MPLWCYIQHFFSYSFLSRKDSSSILAKPEYFFLWCMMNNMKFNFECWLATQFWLVLPKKNKLLILGFYITHLAVNLGLLDLVNHDLHLGYLVKMLVVERTLGEYMFTPSGPIQLASQQGQH